MFCVEYYLKINIKKFYFALWAVLEVIEREYLYTPLENHFPDLMALTDGRQFAEYVVYNGQLPPV